MKIRAWCGPDWFPQWIRKILSIRFNASCKIHDLDYHSTRFDREEADTRFLLHMIRQANKSIFWETIATVYYIFVRIGGKLQWGTKVKED